MPLVPLWCDVGRVVAVALGGKAGGRTNARNLVRLITRFMTLGVSGISYFLPKS